MVFRPAPRTQRARRVPHGLTIGLGLALVAASCGSSGESANSLPEVTLVTTLPPVTVAGEANAGEEEPVVVQTPDTDPPASTDVATTDAVVTTEASVTTEAGAGEAEESEAVTDDGAEDTTPDTDPAGADPEDDETNEPADGGDTAELGDDATPPEAVESLELSDKGLGDVRFGAEPEGVIAFVSSLLGAPTADTGWVDPFTIGPCLGNQLRLVNWGVLELQFGDASIVMEGQPHFFAYAYGFDGEVGAAPVGLRTADGITVGSTVIDVLSNYPGVVLNPEDDFISANFIVNDNFRGFVTGLGDEDLVTVVLGGVPCGE